MLSKLIVVYNPRSSKHQRIEKEVLAPSRKLQGWLVGKYEVKAESLEENAKQLAEIINDGDLVIAAGGDGTAAMAANGVILSKKQATLAVLGYGNFNDMSRMLGTKRPVEYGDEFIGGVSEIVENFLAEKTTQIYPLDVKVNGKHWRYAPCYVSLGLLAESTTIFDEPKIRERLKTGKRSRIYSLIQLAKWYFKHHKEEFLPAGELEHLNCPKIVIDGAEGGGMRLKPKTTDYIAVNGPSVARLMRGGCWYRKPDTFKSTTARLGNLGGLLWFMLRSVSWRIPTKKTQGDLLKFNEASEVEIQAEGEYQRLEKVKKVEVLKSKRSLRVVLK